jgi:3-oxoacid CoA-transferase B subunit/3-oxoacid CoA-transferase A subunit
LIDQGATDLTVISNNTGSGEVGLAALLKAAGPKVICSFPAPRTRRSSPSSTARAKTELELVPQGTLAERIRAGGAGVPAFYTPTASARPSPRARSSASSTGAVRARARADAPTSRSSRAHRRRHGNVLYNKTARNFAPDHGDGGRTRSCRRASRRRAGRDRPECVVTPGIFVDRVVEVADPVHESDLIAAGCATREPDPTNRAPQRTVGLDPRGDGPRVAQDIPDGSYVNLGIGIPELVARFVPEGRELIYHTENGLLGMGPSPAEPGEGDPELINAGKRRVTALPGAAYFHHADSFAMIRGGHLDLCVLGALQVAQNGDLANWSTGEPGAIPAVGGAMDLVAGVKTVFVITQHCTKTASPSSSSVHLSAHRPSAS